MSIRDVYAWVDTCPFCGSDRQQIKSVWKTWYFVACECKAGGAPAPTEDKAVENWNRREG